MTTIFALGEAPAINLSDGDDVSTPLSGFTGAPRHRVWSLKSSAMLKTFSLSVLYFLTLGLLVAAYASLPV